VRSFAFDYLFASPASISQTLAGHKAYPFSKAQFALNGDGLIRRARRIENWLPIQTDRVEGGRGEDG